MGEIMVVILWIAILYSSYLGITYLFGGYRWETWEEYQEKQRKLRSRGLK